MTPFVRAIATASLVALLGAAPGQTVSDGQLQLFMSRGQYPVTCNEAQIAANGLRAKPTTDPEHLVAAAKIFHACATSPAGIHSDALRNGANFAASAALLLAARYDSPAHVRDDATAARDLSQTIVDYRAPAPMAGKSHGSPPSPYITDAGRINRDAKAILASLPAPG